MKLYQQEILNDLKVGFYRIFQLGSQNLLSKLISIIVIVIAALSITTGGILQFVILVIGILAIVYLAGNYDSDIKKKIEEAVEETTSTGKHDDKTSSKEDNKNKSSK